MMSPLNTTTPAVQKENIQTVEQQLRVFVNFTVLLVMFLFIVLRSLK